MELIKFGVINKHKSILTWTQPFNDTVENIINLNKNKDRWLGGKFEFIRTSNTIDGKYTETHLNPKEFNHLLKN